MMTSSSRSTACPAGVTPPGGRPRGRLLLVAAAVLALGIGVADEAAVPSSTEALFTSQAASQVNSITAEPLTCDGTVDEPKPGRTAVCSLVVTNDGPDAVPLTADVTTKSTSSNDQPILYWNGPPSEDPPPNSPHYRENLYITDSLSGSQLGFGALSCVRGTQGPGTCSSSDIGQPVSNLAPGQSDTFTITVELDKGDDNSGALSVTLVAHAGQLSPALIDTTNLS